MFKRFFLPFQRFICTRSFVFVIETKIVFVTVFCLKLDGLRIKGVQKYIIVYIYYFEGIYEKRKAYKTKKGYGSDYR